MLLDIDAQRLRLAQEFLSGIEQKETTPYIKVGHYNDPLRWMMLLIFLPNIARSLSWAKLGVCVSRQAGTFWIVVSRWHRSGGETTFVTKSYQRRLSCACRLILALLFLEQQLQVGWLQYTSSRNKRTVPGGEIYWESPVSIILGNSEKDKVELIPSWQLSEHQPSWYWAIT